MLKFQHSEGHYHSEHSEESVNISKSNNANVNRFFAKAQTS